MYRVLGRFISIVTWPAIRLLLLNTKRAYLVIMFNDEVLVLKTWLSVKNVWRLPGGGLKKNEQPIAGLLRECQEELGLVINQDQLSRLGKGAFRSNWHFDYWLYSIKLAQKPSLNLSNIEIIGADWIKITELPNHPCSDELKTALKVM